MSSTAPDLRTADIAFVGGGNMARSLIAGLVRQGADPRRIRVAEPVAALREALAAEYAVQAVATAADAVEGAALWMFAVKPQVLRSVCTELAALALAQRPLLVSIAAGITTQQLDRWLGGGHALVRAMPNTPALLGAGVTGLYANAGVDAAQRSHAERVLAAAGVSVWVEDEALIDAVTAVSGSGPAYVFLLAEAMEAAGIAQGLPAAAARTLVLQTMLGAARMLTESSEAPSELRRRVTSPNGTTQAAIETFQAGGFEALTATAIAAAAARGRALSAAND
ncbi:pyrroline-5-carboxylate reductase [Xanthomonas translucens]|uniref:Pyrroline-5-carboxylate reductase n=3 Tax=Xanthomonas campestris pv. translucens TaxID=343 RepID=A0A1C3TLA3_XANCT|nr:pyrroline-5-carboxylate reductase [Xanthomonas translucens]MCC8447441.1 pyrroline-5-carboxylate reductase [Xanthomonas translucens pv. translucens]MCT8285083.1 pyrroline-5-carboxylate reductase [Xanthomonas translucens pv. translucens]MCT8302741.1 pyrroline-5-carboxylate reductase [Xanthomonas translucens pv. translucens]QSQ29865.1 pyrroline-5-carboxylate reductase [Xanthomonas translucens pv. translucens]QSQ34338.1 pyrroline-5-carboxylate reductase [Xanthomonas translucens pv. translucens]